MNIINDTSEPWIRPWEIEKFDDLYNRDDRFFSILIKGTLNFLNRNIIMYGKPIQHYIFQTGSSFLYIESNGYEFSWNETSGEDQMYMKLPRCIIELGDISVVQDELTSPYSVGIYERRNGTNLQTYDAEIRRLPLEMNLNLKYYLGTFNESIILIQELVEKLVFQKYFKINYLGQIIQCSIEFPESMSVQLNQIDLASPDPNQRTIDIAIKVKTNYPLINSRTSVTFGNINFGGESGTGLSYYTNKYGRIETEYSYSYAHNIINITHGDPSSEKNKYDITDVEYYHEVQDGRPASERIRTYKSVTETKKYIPAYSYTAYSYFI